LPTTSETSAVAWFKPKALTSAFLLIHGAVKLFVVGLARNKLWSYPAALFVFAGFAVFQVYEFAPREDGEEGSGNHDWVSAR